MDKMMNEADEADEADDSLMLHLTNDEMNINEYMAYIFHLTYVHIPLSTYLHASCVIT